MHYPPAESNFCDEHGNALKPAIIQDYNRHTGYVDNSDYMTNTYSISRQTWKWPKKLFFHLLDLMILNGYILLTFCSSKLSHRDFKLSFVKDLLEEGGKVFQMGNAPQDIPTFSTSWLDIRHIKGMQWRCCVFFTGKKVQPDILKMCEMQYGVVCGAMFPDLPHPAKILRPSPH